MLRTRPILTALLVFGSALNAWAKDTETPKTPAKDDKKPQPAPLVIDVDYSEVPEMKPWCEKAKGILVEWQPKLAEELHVDGYTPPRHVTVVFRKNKRGVADTRGSHIECAARWFRAHPDDVGALVHELAHVVQSYPTYDPPWLVEGIADYERFWVYEPGAPRTKMDPKRSSYRDSYRTTAAFLNWIVKTYDKKFVQKINADLHHNKYKQELFKTYTGKDIDTLWGEFTKTM
jgi:hypothetical protein